MEKKIGPYLLVRCIRLVLLRRAMGLQFFRGSWEISIGTVKNGSAGVFAHWFRENLVRARAQQHLHGTVLSTEIGSPTPDPGSDDHRTQDTGMAAQHRIMYRPDRDAKTRAAQSTVP